MTGPDQVYRVTAENPDTLLASVLRRARRAARANLLAAEVLRLHWLAESGVLPTSWVPPEDRAEPARPVRDIPLPAWDAPPGGDQAEGLPPWPGTADRAAIRRRHYRVASRLARPGLPACAFDGQIWPCETARLLNGLEAALPAAAWLHAHRGAVGNALASAPGGGRLLALLRRLP